MSTRLLLEVAIRVLGIWMVFSAITGATSIAVGYLPFLWSYPVVGLAESLIGSGLAVVVHSGVGAVAVWCAPWIAARFYPARSEDAQLLFKVGPGDVYRVACFVLGVYLLADAAEPAARLAMFSMQGSVLTANSGRGIADLIAATVHLAAGTLLVFGSRWIGDIISHLRYDPDTIPRQQISLAVLLLCVLGVAVVLGILRTLTR